MNSKPQWEPTTDEIDAIRNAYRAGTKISKIALNHFTSTDKIRAILGSEYVSRRRNV